jgi:hypothetical protein
MTKKKESSPLTGQGGERALEGADPGKTDEGQNTTRAVLSKSGWRDFLPIHPAAELFPLLPAEELQALADDVKANGLLTPVSLIETPDGDVMLLEGRCRLDALERNGMLPGSVKEMLKDGIAFMEPPDTDPFDFVKSANIHRRHLTIDQKREAVDRLLKLDPGISDRTIGALAKVDNKTVAVRRRLMEASEEIPQTPSRVDSKGHRRPGGKPPRKGKRAELSAADLIRELRKLSPQLQRVANDRDDPDWQKLREAFRAVVRLFPEDESETASTKTQD